MNYKIALNFEDGVTRFVTCLPGDTVADAAYRFGVNIPLDCREGACGTCKAICESGSVNMTDYVDEALSVEEAAAGYVLTCKARPTSDCVIRIPSSSSACKAVDNTVRKASISRLEQLSPSTIHLELAGPEIEKLHFLPGQYANLFVPGSEASRAYSFSSLARGGKVGFLIRNVPNGMMSGFLTGAAKEGDALRYQAPFGGFYLRKVERPVLMIAGGTGLAPFLAMLEQMDENSLQQPVRLLYGVSRDEDLVALEKLDHFKESIANFDYTACVADTALAGRKRGVVTDYLSPAHFHEGRVDVYLCGPPPMVVAVEQFIRSEGVKPAAIYFEKFLPGR